MRDNIKVEWELDSCACVLCVCVCCIYCVGASNVCFFSVVPFLSSSYFSAHCCCYIASMPFSVHSHLLRGKVCKRWEKFSREWDGNRAKKILRESDAKFFERKKWNFSFIFHWIRKLLLVRRMGMNNFCIVFWVWNED